MLRQKLYKLKQEQGVESEPLFPILKQEPPSPGQERGSSVIRRQVRVDGQQPYFHFIIRKCSESEGRIPKLEIHQANYKYTG